MSASDAAGMDRAIARTLAAAVNAALTPEPRQPALTAARDAAQVLSLKGLDRVLAVCQTHVGNPLPTEFEAVTDRMRRLAAESLDCGDIGAFRRADAELDSLAAELESYEWSEQESWSEERQPAIPTLSLARVLEDVTIAGDESRLLARRLRLTAPVAASLRAALDWLAPENLAVRSVRLHGEPSLLEVRLEQINPAGITAAHRVLAAVGGNLGPALEGVTHAVNGEWMLRVASFSERATYLLVVQRGVRLALPWHAVLRLRVMGAADLDPDSSRLSHPVLDSPAAPTPGASEYPVVLLAHGLKRANLIADRLVWRMMADPCENEWGSPGPGLLETVRTDEGEVYWVADPGRLLQAIALPELPPVRRAPPEPSVPTLTNADVEAVRGSAPAAGRAPAAPVVAPSTGTAPGAGPAATPATAAGATAVGAVAATLAARPPRALVAEDSLTARVFLARLLGQQGVEAEMVSTAAELLARIGEEPWALVLADVDLPDGHGADWLTRARQAVAERAPGARLAALVRDAADLNAARLSGVSDALLKPYDRADLESLLARLGLGRS